MLWIHPDDAPRGPDDYKRFVCAELPDPIEDKELHEKVVSLMIHGPCGGHDDASPRNPSAPCLTKGLTKKRCEKGYPKQFAKEYAHGENSEPIYQRRSPEDGGFTGTTYCNALKANVPIDNRDVVPHNLSLIHI